MLWTYLHAGAARAGPGAGAVRVVGVVGVGRAGADSTREPECVVAVAGVSTESGNATATSLVADSKRASPAGLLTWFLNSVHVIRYKATKRVAV